ncbi:histone [Methanosarcinales archaeon ex4484_138]|nr:MAG: histone [Methanosarcinales archaeon ex4484_138]RLG22448.1 MAG: histone [Methanosarcinales archaeon]CAD7771415.1 MAG: Archaeal histone A [Candidatus Methanoperedenaceae archaeon GB50]CAD7772472.1 Archaeal histone A [Candidatus Methanoperedenaceae archaeon GB37]HHI30343.1 histone family protein [Candidatus Methanoperedenaceae archaeon]
MAKAKTNILPLASVERIIRSAGAKRVSETGSHALAEYLEGEGVRITRRAIELAKHAKRVTVTGEDIKQALKEL